MSRQVKSAETYSGSKHHSAKFDNHEIRQIRYRYWELDESQESIALDFNVSQTTICKIVNHRSYRNVP